MERKNGERLAVWSCIILTLAYPIFLFFGLIAFILFASALVSWTGSNFFLTDVIYAFSWGQAPFEGWGFIIIVALCILVLWVTRSFWKSTLPILLYIPWMIILYIIHPVV
jgi:hypothetical protein